MFKIRSFMFFYLYLIFQQINGLPLQDNICYASDTEEMVCCDDPEFMKNEYGNCLRSDTKYTQVLEEIRGNASCFKYIYYPFLKLSLEENDSGYIHDFVMTCTDIKLKSFIPKGKCTVTINKGKSTLELESDSKMMALVKLGLKSDIIVFDGFKSIPIVDTCTAIEVFCAKSHFIGRYCYKKHLECFKLLNSYFLPETIARSICSNLNLIIIAIITLLVFKVTDFLIKSHFFLIVFPIYYPICIIIYYVYNKACCKCKICGKPYHPFSECSPTCKCGAIFNNSEILKRHLEFQKCQLKTLPIVKMMLFNKIFQFFNNITIIAILMLMVIPSVNSYNTNQINSDTFLWKKNLEQYINKLEKGLLEDGFEKVQGALKFYKNNRNIILNAGENYVTFDIPSKTYETTKISLLYNKQVVSELGITIEKSNLVNNYRHIYDTGNIKHFKVNHDESCTGTCPNREKKLGWVSFEKEATSVWGCEDFGCLAIKSGCVWGECDDIIDPLTIGKVLKKVETIDKPSVRVCIYMASDGFCKTITMNTVIHHGIKLQLINNDLNVLPRLVYVDKYMNAFFGPINDLGIYNSECGQLQIVNGTNFGTGDPLYEIICFAASKKEIKLHRCRHNNYEKCLNLERVSSDGINAVYNEGIMSLERPISNGFIKVTIDVQPYIGILQEDKVEDFEVSFSGLCSGCQNCPLGINCNLKIKSTKNLICDIVSEYLDLSLSIVIVSAGERIYNVVGFLKSKYIFTSKAETYNIKIDICGKSAIFKTLVKNDLNSLENAWDFDKTTLNQGDSACNNAFCDFFNKTLSNIFSISKLEGVLFIVFTILALFLIIFVSIKLIVPIVLRIHQKIKMS